MDGGSFSNFPFFSIWKLKEQGYWLLLILFKKLMNAVRWEFQMCSPETPYKMVFFPLMLSFVAHVICVCSWLLCWSLYSPQRTAKLVSSLSLEILRIGKQNVRQSIVGTDWLNITDFENSFTKCSRHKLRVLPV